MICLLCLVYPQLPVLTLSFESLIRSQIWHIVSDVLLPMLSHLLKNPSSSGLSEIFLLSLFNRYQFLFIFKI